MVQTQLNAFVDAFNAHDLDAFNGILARRYFDYEPPPEEPTQAAAFIQVAGAVHEAFPDGVLTVSDVEVDDAGTARGTASFHGTYTGALFGSPNAHGQRYQLSASVQAAPAEGDRIVIAFSNLDPVRELRTLGVLPYPAWGQEPPTRHPAIPEVLIRLFFNGLRLEEKPCQHVADIAVPEPPSPATECPPCVASGDVWPALRMCLTCGHIGCCDAAKNKHARRHHEETGHPMVRSVTPGEGWIWCYADSAVLSSRHLGA